MKMKVKFSAERKEEIWALVLLAISALVAVSLFSYNGSDLAGSAYPANTRIRNLAGIVGAHLSDAMFKLVGKASYILPILLLIWALNRFQKIPPQKIYVKSAGVLTFFLSCASLLYMISPGDQVLKFHSGGFVGFIFSNFLTKYFGGLGAYIVILCLVGLSVLLATEFLLWPLFRKLFVTTKDLLVGLKSRVVSGPGISIRTREQRRTIKINTDRQRDQRINEKEKKTAPQPQPAAPRIIKPPIVKIRTEPPPEPVKIKRKVVVGDYNLPTLDLLDSPPPVSERTITDDLKENSRILEETLLDFDIEAKVVEVNRGPVITRYELEPAPGIKVNKITGLSDDIALAMKAQSVRVVAPIPGKGTIGFEIPNTTSTLVYLKDVLESKDFQSSKSKLALGIGKDIAGSSVIAELDSMPHLLIAGATGSGKTVCVNSFIMSLLLIATPDEVKFIMIDPKMVELACFNGLPHLLCPVVTDVKKVSAALEWVVAEMDQRYRLFAQIGVRNIDLYNEKIKEKVSDAKEEQPAPLPYIVVIIDELADLMMVAADDIESAIMRLAQLSRAVGIHIILATQRPSVDVITGVIKANFPARISFKVASKVDSRTVLDANGADKLLGKGDLLFIQPGASKPIRAQGSLVTDKEIERVVNFIKSQREADYNTEIINASQKQNIIKKFQKDEVYQSAVKLVLASKQASVSLLQRRLGLGYTRAARLIDMMEQEGIVGPYQGSKPRDILVESLEEIEKQQAPEGAQGE